MKAPILFSPRLKLRPFSRADHCALHEMWSDAEMTRFITGKESSLQESWLRLLSYAGMWSTIGYGYWAIESRRDASFVGQAGVANFMRSDGEIGQLSQEVGWMVARHHQNKGYATEAAKCLLEWCARNLEGTVFATVRSGNDPSFKMLRALKFSETKRIRTDGKELHVFQRELSQVMSA